MFHTPKKKKFKIERNLTYFSHVHKIVSNVLLEGNSTKKFQCRQIDNARSNNIPLYE